jgi:site-specific DNA recombinase
VFNRATAKVAGKRNTHASKPDDEVIRVPGGMPRIVDDDTWARVQLRLGDNKRNASNSAKRIYLLSGKIVCGKCGSLYVGKRSVCGRNKSLYAYYICGKRDRSHSCDMPRISAEVIEQQVLDAITKTLGSVDEKMIDTILTRIREQRETEPPEIQEARAALKKVQKQIASVVCAIRDGAYHPALREELQKLSDTEASLNATLASAADLPTPTRDEVAAFLEKAQNIKKLSRDEQKRVIADLVEEIVIRDRGDKYLTFRVFSAPMVEQIDPNTNIVYYLGGFALLIQL